MVRIIIKIILLIMMPDLCKTHLIDYEINDDLHLEIRNSVSNGGSLTKKALEVLDIVDVK